MPLLPDKTLVKRIRALVEIKKLLENCDVKLTSPLVLNNAESRKAVVAQNNPDFVTPLLPLKTCVPDKL
jgi:hypothetical protein